jgi:beta-mannosidase
MSLNDCLSVIPVQALNRQELSAGWRMAIATLGEGEDRGFARQDFDDDEWAPVAVPRLHGATAGNEAIWYRHRFPRPKHRQRTLLRFEGAFLVANVWLNGRLLGSHYGYFAPFSFDVSSFLLDENVLAVCVEAPVELDLPGKRHVMGLFNDWDGKPYPSRELGQLGEQFAWHVPMGLWRPVLVEQVGHVIAEWLHCEPRVEDGDLARLTLRTRLRNLDGRIMTGELGIRVAPENFNGGSPLEMKRALRLAGHEVQDVVIELALPHPRLWSPWAQGEPSLYRAEIEVVADERRSAALSELFGIRDVGLQTRAEGWTFRLNGRPMFMRGANYLSEFFLDAATDDRLGKDLDLARQANMDMLRLPAHLEPPGLYEAADRQGMLLWQDMPLVASYVHRGDARSTAFFREAVLAQVEEAVHLLYNHPSVAVYAVHAQPPWCTSQAWVGERHTEQLNRDVDEEALTLIRELDASRPSLAASGDQDAQTALTGHGRHSGADDPVFISDLGLQSLPNANSPAWRSLNRSWPIADDDQSWRYAGYHPQEWAQSGVGPPSAHLSRDAYIGAGQEFQAGFLRSAVLRARRHKFAHCGGILIAPFVDPFPAISASIVDHARRPKRAYRAVSDAFAPLLLTVDLPDETGSDSPLPQLGRGRPYRLRLLIVNDDPEYQGVARLRWRVDRERGPQSGWWRSARGWFARRRFGGQLWVTIPDQAEPAAVVAEPLIRLHADGLYRISAELDVDGTRVALMDERFLVSEPPARRRRISEDQAVRRLRSDRPAPAAVLR